MEFDFKMDLTSVLDHEGVSSFLYIHSDQNEPFEFFIGYDQMMDSVIDMNIIPNTDKLSKEGFDELALMVKSLREQADKIEEAMTYFKPAEESK